MPVMLKPCYTCLFVGTKSTVPGIRMLCLQMATYQPRTSLLCLGVGWGARALAKALEYLLSLLYR